MSTDFINQPLNDLVTKVFKSLEFIILSPRQVLNHPLANSRLSYVLKREDSTSELIGVIIRDWKRIVGVGQIHKAEELTLECPGLTHVLIVSSLGFSYSAARLAEKVGIGLISRGELVSLSQNRVEII